MLDAVELTQKLIAFDTTNPPGDEAACASYVAEALERNGFTVTQHEFGENRINVVARLDGLEPELEPLVLTGHLDTVPLGNAPWASGPFSGDIHDGKLYGRGSSDMKSGVAAMMVAACDLVKDTEHGLQRGLVLIFTGGEETGCAGAVHLMDNNLSGIEAVSAMIVGEPTGNQLYTAHKGGLFMRAVSSGVTAHSSTPELGENAIYKAARAITSIENYGFNEAPHPQLGSPSINVGMVSGGLNANSVPDHAEFTIDIRTNAVKEHADFLGDLQTYLGGDVTLEAYIDMPGIDTDMDDPFAKLVAASCVSVLKEDYVTQSKGLSFFTDASAFQPHFNCPTIVLGPGELSTMHQTDEFCYVTRIEQAVEIYKAIILGWCAETSSQP